MFCFRCTASSSLNDENDVSDSLIFSWISFVAFGFYNGGSTVEPCRPIERFVSVFQLNWEVVVFSSSFQLVGLLVIKFWGGMRKPRRQVVVIFLEM